jgi:hypothetical protein
MRHYAHLASGGRQRECRMYRSDSFSGIRREIMSTGRKQGSPPRSRKWVVCK